MNQLSVHDCQLSETYDASDTTTRCDVLEFLLIRKHKAPIPGKLTGQTR